MVTTLDTKMRLLAQSLIEKFGTSATYAYPSSTVYDPSTGAATKSSTDVTWTISPPSRVRDRMVDNDRIQAGDFMCFLAAKDLSYVPALGGKFTWSSDTWTIVDLQPIISGDQIAAYRMIVRR